MANDLASLIAVLERIALVLEPIAKDQLRRSASLECTKKKAAIENAAKANALQWFVAMLKPRGHDEREACVELSRRVVPYPEYHDDSVVLDPDDFMASVAEVLLSGIWKSYSLGKRHTPHFEAMLNRLTKKQPKR